MRTKITSVWTAAVAALLLTACSGGGGGSSSPSSPVVPNGTATGTPIPAVNATPTPFPVPAPAMLNLSTTYTVYFATVNASQLVAITPLNSGPPDSTLGWQVVTTGAIITYPDGSTQISDSLGNFDAANPTVAWVQNNAAAIAANPQLQPEIIVSLISAQNQTPLDTTVAAYPSTSATVLASAERAPNAGRRTSAAATTTAPELASVTIHPRGVAMFDNEKRTFTLVGSDSDGQFVDLSKASVAWKVGKPAGCSDANGSVKPASSDAARAVYAPPSSGTFVCPDVVTATVTVGSGASLATYSATSNAFWYDPSSGVAWSGTLNDATNKAVPNGLVTLFGGGKEFYRGNLVAFTNASGQFARTIPPNRTMVPVGGNLATTGGRAAATFFTLSPATVVAGASGTTLPATTYTEGGSFANPFKPLPAYDRALRDAWFITGIAQDQFPFGRPSSNGKYPKCSIDAIVNKQSDSLACSKVGDNGYFDNWTIATPVAGTWIFQEPATVEGGRHALQVQSATTVTAPYGISDPTTTALTCATPQACFTFIRVYNPAGLAAIPGPIGSANGALTGIGNNPGTILAADGGFAEIGNFNNVQGAFTAYYIRNEYTVGHQVQGQPLYAHTVNYAYSGGGATTIAVQNNWYNSFGNAAGSLSVVFTPSAAAGGLSGATPLYTYRGSGSRQYYKSTPGGQTPSALLGFNITGALNYDHSAQSTVTLTQAPDPTLINGSITMAFNSPFAACPAGYPAPVAGSVARVCATLNSPNLPAGVTLQTPNIATYTVDANYVTSVSLDPVFGVQAAAFHL